MWKKRTGQEGASEICEVEQIERPLELLRKKGYRMIRPMDEMPVLVKNRLGKWAMLFFSWRAFANNNLLFVQRGL